MEARDEQALLALFAPDATWTADGGGKAGAAPLPIVGADAHRQAGDRYAGKVLGCEPHAPGRHSQRRDRPLHPRRRSLTATMSIATDGEHILAVYAVVNPDKLN